MTIKEIQELLSNLQNEIYSLKADSTQLQDCRATLYVNFVKKATSGIQFTEEEADIMNTHKLMFEVLLKYMSKVTS